MNPDSHRASRRLVIGFEGREPDAAFVDLLHETGAGGVILFARNIVDADQTRALIERLRGLVDWPLLIAVDQEGGPVVRVTKGATVFPGNMALGAAGDPSLAEAQGRISGAELASMDFDLNLAPVIDLQTNPANPGIGIRSFAADRAQARELAEGYVRGHAAAGIATCLKHFPGKGAAGVDAHIDLPVLDLELSAFRDPHLEVFGDLIGRLEGTPLAIMSTHILVRGLDAELPATLSPRVMRSILRDDLGFAGPVVTDCLEMGAIVKRWGVPDAALSAARAGHDLLLVCHTPERQRGAAQRLNDALERGELDADENRRSLERIAGLRRRREAVVGPSTTEGAELARRIAEGALTRFGDERGLLPLDPAESLHIVAGRPRSVVGAEEEDDGDWSVRLRRLAADAGFDEVTLRIFEPADEGSVAPVVEEVATRSGKTVLLGWDARGQAGSRRMLAELSAKIPERLVVAHVRNPFDQALVEEGITAVTPFGYTNTQIAALFGALAGRSDWPGRMPAPLV